MKRTLFNTYIHTILEATGMTIGQYNEEYGTFYTEDNEYEAVDFVTQFEIDDVVESFKGAKTNGIIAIADIGTWHGRVPMAFKELRRLEDVIYTNCDYAHLYVERGQLKMDASHHDGTNFMVFREYKDFIDYDQEQRFLSHLYNGTATKSIINYYTTSLGKTALEALGWE